MDTKAFLKSVSGSPGVYLMKGADKQILYIGKAANLKKRLKSYFYNQGALEPKIRIMLAQVEHIDLKLCSSETEALILESELIRKLKPKYNTLGRDDKGFPWVEITKDDFPVVSVIRPKAKSESMLIGPFTSAYLLRTALKAIRSIFPFSMCSKKSKKACLNYFLRLCPAPCEKKITKRQYQQNIKMLIKILQGKQKTIRNELLRRMHSLSKRREYEDAALVRDQIQALETLWEEQPSIGPTSILWQLKSSLGLKRLPLRIEGFDISNIAGNQNVGSLVSFYKTQADKSQYRRFRVKTVSGANDYQSILEILKRRFERIKQENLDTPDLIVVDGGQPQVSAVNRALKEVGFDIDCIGLAKKKEQIYLADNPKPIDLPPDSKAKQLIQQVRNEAHRFALKYHRLLRKKKMLEKNEK